MKEISPSKEKDLPAPDEKLLRAPTFIEKYGRVKLTIIVALLVAIVDLLIYLFLLR